MTSIASPAHQNSGPEYAVHMMRGDTLIGRTEPTANLADAREALTALRLVYAESILVARALPEAEWEPLTDDEVHQFAYQYAATVLADLVGEGLPRLDWTLSADGYDGPRLTAHSYFDDDGARRDTLAAYAALLGVEPTVRCTERSTSIKVSGVYHGVPVQVSASFVAVATNASAEAVAL